MSYTGLLTIRDEEGQLRYERSLSTNEIVDCLLGPRPVVQQAPALIESPKKRKYTKRETTETPAAKKKGKYTDEQKADALRRLANGESAKSIADELGAYANIVYYWKEHEGKSGADIGRRHECCGSKGARHLNDCPMNRRKAGTSKNAHLVANRKTAFSNGTYSSVKNALDSGDTVDMIVRSKGLDEQEVRRINLADSYEEYLRIA